MHDETRPPVLAGAFRLWVVAASVTAAASLGFLLGLGRRAGTTWRPLNAAAHTLLGARADGVWDFNSRVTPTGGVVVLVVSAAAAFVVARIASSFRRMHVAAAVGVSLLGYLLHLHVVARSPGGLAALLSVGELRALYVMVSVVLVVGMRLALSEAAGMASR